MREKKRLLIILIGVCVVLGLAMWLLLRTPEAENDPSSDSPAEHEHEIYENFIENADGDLLIDKNSEDVCSIVLTNKNGTFSILRDNVTADLYIKEIDRVIPLSADFIEYVWYYAYCLGYNYKIISTSDAPLVLSDYGLDSPVASFEITYTDGTAARFYLGDALATTDNVYYLTFDGIDNTVFITEMSIAAFEGESYFIDTNFFSYIDGSEEEIKIGKIKISGTAVPKAITIEPYSSDDRSDQSYGHSHIITSPVRTAVNDVNATALVNELIYLAAETAVCSAPDKEILKEYGLDKPSLVFTFMRNGKEQVLSIGKTDKSTYCYAMIKGIDVIYDIDPVQAEAILSSSLSFYRTGELRLFRINAVEEVNVSFGDENYDFTVERSAISDGGDYYEYHLFSEGKELSIDSYRSFLSVISSAYASSWDTKAVSDTPSLKIRVKFFDSFDRKDDVMEFYEADFNRFICRINGTDTASVSAIFLTRVMNASRALASGQPVTD